MSEPIRIELDQPPPSEPGLYLVQLNVSHPVTTTVVWKHSGDRIFACGGLSLRYIAEHYPRARWSRRIEVHPTAAPAKE